MKLRAAFFAASAAVLVLACSSSSSSPPANQTPVATPGTASDLEKAIDARAKAYCDRVFDCCDAKTASTLMSSFAGGDVARDKCEAGVKETLKAQRTGALTALERKDLEFFPSKEAECLKTETAKDCPSAFAAGPQTGPKFVCAAAFTGKLKEGAACVADGACESTFCKIETEIGKCFVRAGEGDPCTGTEECPDGLYCHRTGAAPSCKFQDGVCKAREGKPEGETCCTDEECATGDCAQTNKGPKCVPLEGFSCNP